eukprot:CAMPEP_0179085524 /NCGR_PEP_ID=MMETSP0796-20121207/38738_1 /TAXON_ID=73915 /ORGANISM="Pyrodinium bahamense, Strain pbaha01" /LENGTH=386 /DNA_ID=CAMNT_0020782965 /DNA_START=65 /DNA_END=1225 /DNA_ORIENTATION=-
MPTPKPTNADAQRIISIMDELKEKLTYLSVATEQVLRGLQSEDGQQACDALGPELMKLFAEQIRLEELYVVANSASDGGYGNADDNEDVNEDVKLLKKNTLDLCRKMRAVPNVVKEMRPLQDTKPGALIQFLKTLAEMQDLTLKRLSTTVEEERSRQELLEHHNSQASEASKRKQQLELDLQHVRRESEKAQSHRTEILTKLKADLLDVKEQKQESMQALRRRYENRMKEHQEVFQQKKTDLENRIKALKESNAKLKLTSQDEENTKKKLAKRNDVDVLGIIKNYDDRVKEMAFKLSEHQELYTKDQRKLGELREHFEKVDEERANIEAEERITEARRSKLEEERKRRSQASSLVQAFWRGIIQREQFTVMKRSKKKKGGGKKKGK